MPISTTVRYEKRDRVAWLAMNRPEALNALNPELGQAMADAIADATEDDEVLVIVLMGEGGRAFSSGMDLKWRAQSDASGVADQPGAPGPGTALNAVSNCPKPVIAAIDGYCLAGGMQLASRCDMRIATGQSRFGMLEARRGLATVGGVDTPELFMPPGEAAWVLMTGAYMSAERAYQIGYIQQVVDDRDELTRAAEEMAGLVKLCAPLAVRVIKEVLRTRQNMPTPQANELSLTKLAELTREVRDRNNKSEDRLEGPRAFAEKRDPVWKNR